MEYVGSIDIIQIANNKASIVLFAIIFTLTYWAIHSRQPCRRYPPALRSLPIVGSTPFLPPINDLPEFFRETAIRLKSNVFSLYQGSDYTVVLNGRDAITEALVKKSSDYADRAPPYTLKHYLNTRLLGLINARYDEKFRRHHQITLSTLREFGFGKKIMEHRIIAEAEDLIDRIKNLEGGLFDPGLYLNLCTVNVINSIAFGKRLPQSDPSLEKMSAFYQFFVNCGRRFIDLCPILEYLPKYKAIMKETLERHSNNQRFLLEEVRECLKNGSESFVQRFAEREGKDLDEVGLMQLIDDLLVAGSETTATSLHWSLYYMANNPDIQRRLRDEINSVVPFDRYPSLDDMSSLPQVEAAILEFLRIRTVIPLSLQRCTMRDTQVSGYFIPVKTRVVVNLHSIHMDPVEWPEPDVYRPGRFLDPEGRVIGRDRVIPFSLGKRSCLGELLARQEIFLIFSSLLQRFQILPPEGQDKIESKPNLVITLCPTPFLIRLIPID